MADRITVFASLAGEAAGCHYDRIEAEYEVRAALEPSVRAFHAIARDSYRWHSGAAATQLAQNARGLCSWLDMEAAGRREAAARAAAKVETQIQYAAEQAGRGAERLYVWLRDYYEIEPHERLSLQLLTVTEATYRARNAREALATVGL